jgi:sugar-specific transcriptional regulator TrmB
MGNQTFIEEIKKLGLSEHEAKCYIALLEKKSLSVAEISKLTGIARPNAYDAMERLMAKGLSISIPGDTKIFSASDPRFLQERALNVELENLEKRKKEILGMDSMIEKLGSLYKNSRGNGNSLECVQVFKNPEQILRKHLQLLSEAQ